MTYDKGTINPLLFLPTLATIASSLPLPEEWVTRAKTVRFEDTKANTFVEKKEESSVHVTLASWVKGEVRGVPENEISPPSMAVGARARQRLVPLVP